MTTRLLLMIGLSTVSLRADDPVPLGGVVVRLGELKRNTLLKPHVNSELDAEYRDWFQHYYRVPFNDVERIVHVHGESRATVLTLSKPVNPSTLAKGVKPKNVLAAGSVPKQPKLSVMQVDRFSFIAVQDSQLVQLHMYFRNEGELNEKEKQELLTSLLLALKTDELFSKPSENELFGCFFRFTEIIDGQAAYVERIPQKYRPLLAAKEVRYRLTLRDRSLSLNAQAEFANAKAAEGAQAAASEGLKAIPEELRNALGSLIPHGEKEYEEFFEGMTKAFEAAKPKLNDKQLTATLTLELDQRFDDAMKRGQEIAREIAKRKGMDNKLKAIYKAIECYEENARFLPQNHFSKDGKTVLLSWRVQILPYLGEEALYKQFKLDEPWDSVHNKTLIERIPVVYRHTHDKTDVAGGTFLQGFVGEKKHKTVPWLIRGVDTNLRFDTIRDGSSNTILLAEAEVAVPWTKPDDIAFDPEGPRPKIGKYWHGGFLVIFADGRTKYIRKDAKDADLKLWIQTDDGQITPSPDD